MFTKVESTVINYISRIAIVTLKDDIKKGKFTENEIQMVEADIEVLESALKKIRELELPE